MIRSLRIGNFKAFAETQEVPLRPLTLVFGPNSAGKSSIIHSLALAHNAIATGDLEAHRTEIGGESIDLGGFRQYVYRRDVTKQVEWTAEIDTASLTGRLGELLAPARTVAIQVFVGQRADAEAGVTACSVLADGRPILTTSRRGGDRMRIDRLDREHPVFREFLKALALSATFAQEVREEDFATLAEAVDELVPDIPVRLSSFFPRVDAQVSAETETMQTLLFTGAGDRPEQLRRAVELFLPRAVRDLINGLADAVEAAIGRLKYLGPLRSYPPRHLAFSAHHDTNWHAGGGAAWDVLRRDASVRENVNRWLGSPDRLQAPYRIDVRKLIYTEEIVEPLIRKLAALFDETGFIIGDSAHEQVGRLMSAFQNGGYLGTVPEIQPDEIVEQWVKSLSDEMTTLGEPLLIDLRSNTLVTHRDVGIGISQVLPVLVNAYGLRSQLVAIEQPEIHLHPKLQGELGDVFVESALGERGNTFVLETHSEHLILRILKRIRETTRGTNRHTPPVRPDDVALLFIEATPKGSVVRNLRVDERGRIVDRIPGGFFEEDFDELF